MTTDRLIHALENVVGGSLPAARDILAAFIQWEYRVIDVTPGPPVLISGTPVATVGNLACPFGPLANIALWPGPSGGYSTPAPGSLILVAFNDGNPAKPRVSGLDPNSFPTSTKFGAAPTPIVPTPWATGLGAALEIFATGLSTTTLAAQASALVTALGLLPPDATTLVEAE